MHRARLFSERITILEFYHLLCNSCGCKNELYFEIKNRISLTRFNVLCKLTAPVYMYALHTCIHVIDNRSTKADGSGANVM